MMDMNKLPQISFVIPLFNEENVFVSLIERLNSVMNASSLSCEVLLVDDGSTDATSSLMRSQSLKDTRYHSVFLSRNFGHQLALSAGIEKALGSEGLFILDGDLQDPPELLDDFYAKLKDGFDVVYGKRVKREKINFINKIVKNSSKTNTAINQLNKLLKIDQFDKSLKRNACFN